MSALVVIIIYLALLLGLGIFSNRLFRGTSRDYMLASSTIGPFFLLMSLFGTTMTAFALVGSTGQAYKFGVGIYGKLASASGIVHSLCFFLIGVPLWRLGRRLNFTTQIEFFRARLDSPRIGIILFPILVGLVIPYLLIGVISAGAVVNGVTIGAFAGEPVGGEPTGWFADYNYGVPPHLASLIITMVVLTYVFFGGMRGTTWANTAQTAVFMVLGLVTFVVIAYGLGGKATLLESLNAATSQVDEAKLTRASISKIQYACYLLIPLSVGMFPHVFQHWLTAKSANSFKLPIIVHPIFIMIVWMPCVLIGVWATAWNPDVGNPNQVLALLVKEQADKLLGDYGPLLSGLLSAGILAAIMSSLDSQFLCMGTMFTNDIVFHYFDEKSFSEKQKVWLARGFVVAVAALTYGIALALGKSRSVFDLGIWCFSGFTGLVPLVLAALYWRRLTEAGAIASIVTTGVIWTILFYQSDFGANKRFGFPTADFHPVVAVTLGSALAMWIVSLCTTPPSAKVLDRFFPKRQDS